jgi:AcrR family transcriptional regulator
MSSDEVTTRSRILNAAWKLLEGNGGEQARMQDIAREAGVSRQAVYLHFKSRAELLVATTHHVDVVCNVDERIERWEAAATGIERLNAWIEMWGGYIPEIYGVGKALLAVRETDDDAAAAWEERMTAVRAKCEATVDHLQSDGVLATRWRRDQAVDLLWSLLSVRTWEHLTQDCGWSTAQYVESMKELLRGALVDQGA